MSSKDADLVEFLRARLTEDETAAHAAILGFSPHPDQEIPGAAWLPIYHKVVQQIQGDDEICVADCGNLMLERAAHIARHDPARVLREVDRDRRLLDLHHVVGFDDEDGHDLGRGCAECGYSAEYSDRGGWCETVRILAVPYADDPDYRQEWKP